MLIFWTWNTSVVRQAREKRKVEDGEKWKGMLGSLMDSTSLLRPDAGGGAGRERRKSDVGDEAEDEDWHALSLRMGSLNFFSGLEGRGGRGVLPVWNSRKDT